MRAPTRYPKRSRTEWQQLRQTAVERFVAGERAVTVAGALHVSYEAVRGWYHQWRDGDTSVLEVRQRGPKPRLTTDQLAQLQTELLRGPATHGYRTELWTLERIARLIKQLFGVAYHPGHVFKIMQALGWSCQKPQRRAQKRDEARIQQWLHEDWPRIKRGP